MIQLEKRIRAALLFIPLFFLLTAVLYADFPIIRNLSNEDVLFRQFHEDISRFYRASMNNEPLPPLLLYRYTPGKDDDIFLISSRLNLPYETLATINGIDKSTRSLSGKSLYIPNVPGIFVPETAQSDLERLMSSWRAALPGQALFIDGKRYTFFPGERFHAVERAFFLNVLFTFPVENGIISSRYGTRISPISGKIHFHTGIDIAAPQGNKVFAARDGRVIEASFDQTLGTYVILQHPGGYITVYGHLESRSVELNDVVNSGMVLGRVGSTGATTGPHLHFEVRKKGESRDPQGLLPRQIRK